MQLDSKMYLKFEIEIATQLEEKNITETYISNVAIDLGKKTTEITGDLSNKTEGVAEKEVSSIQKANTTKIVVSMVTLIISLYIIRYVFVNTIESHNIKSTYKIELNKILRICQDKIVQVSTQIDIGQTDLIEVKDFQEIIKLSEELAKPILCYISKQTEEACFAVVSNGVTYRYILTGEK